MCFAKSVEHQSPFVKDKRELRINLCPDGTKLKRSASKCFLAIAVKLEGLEVLNVTKLASLGRELAAFVSRVFRDNGVRFFYY